MSWLQRGTDINGAAINDFFGLSVSISSDCNTLAIGADDDDIGTGYVRIYTWNQLLRNGTGDWVQRGLDIYGEEAGDRSGSSISLSADGNTVAIGAPDNRSNTGHVRIYIWDQTLRNGAGDWIQRGLDIDGEYPSDRAGIVTLSADGNTVAIGAIQNNNNTGHVRVFTWNGSIWVQRGLDIDGEEAGDMSGSSISLSVDSNTIAIGAIGDNNFTGHVRVYIWGQALRNGAGDWIQRGLDIDGTASDAYFGIVSLSADGNTVAISAPFDTGGTGYVRVYIWEQTLRNGSGDWIQRGSDINGQASGETFGSSISLSADGNILAIGAPDNNNGVGCIRVFVWDGVTWVQRGLEIDGVISDEYSGSSISLSADGNTVAFGAYGNNTNTGAVRVFTYTPPTPPVCFLADAPVLTPTGYKAINTIKEGDTVRTAAGRNVVVKRVFVKEYQPSASANPFVIPKGTFGALRALPISPNHEIMTDKGMQKAKELGLKRMKMTDTFTYYNLELEDWVRDNLVVAGVECESLAPAKRISMTRAEFVNFVKARYGPASAARLRSVCFEESNGRISMPALL